MSGKAFYGRTEDGSDMKEFEGVYVNPKNPNEWSNKPYPKEWVCKGKHQYRKIEKEVNGSLIEVSWVCQCGKSL